MKTSFTVRIAAIALLSGSPFLAHAGADDSVSQCMSVFAKQNFAAQPTSFNAEGPRVAGRAFPLKVAKRTVRVVAKDRTTGEVLASSVCTVNNGVASLGETTSTVKVATR